MSKEFKGIINVDIRDSVPDWTPYEAPKAPEGAPNVLYIVWDDVGFAALSPFGGLIETPAMDRVAEMGLRYTNWHTTALCSPTRSCLLTGRNAHMNGMACIGEATTGFPGKNGHIPFENATIAEVLLDQGYNTYMLGKWHLCPEDEYSMASTKRNWPVGRGFERYYGFLGGETNQWYPDLVYDNHFAEQPYSPEEGYHLDKDLADKAIGFIADAKQIAPDKPFFMYYCPGTAHAPHHAPKEWIEKYEGVFDMGYERYRDVVLERQKEMGIVAPDTEVSAINPMEEGRYFPVDYVKPWDGLSDDEKRLFARMAEVYAGFVSHADYQIGRVIDYLEEIGQLDNTIIVVTSDNGASGEGGTDGSVNENKFFNSWPDSLEENMKFLDVLGGPETYNHYP
ncbi:MAG: sulfatase-like hydrolase/transferase, partial [Anaerolineae bacterium]